MEEEFDNEEYLNSLPPGVREDLESGSEGAWTVGPAEVGAGLMIAPGLVTKAAKTWGAGKVLETGLNIIAPDAEDTLLEQALDSRPALKTGVKGTRLLWENLLEDVFDNRILDTRNRHESITRFSTLQKQTKNRNILDEYVHKKAVEGPHKNWQDQGIPQTELSSEISDLARKNDLQYREGFNPDQIELPLEPFQSNRYQRSVLNKMNKYGMGDGTFRMKAYRAYLNKGDSGRDMLEAYLSPDRLRGSFEGYKKFNKRSWEYKWGDFLKKKGYDLKQGIQVHHINPLYDSIHLFDNVKFNSKEYWELMNILVRNNARPGVIQKGDDINNLMMTLGQKADEATPHGIAHKFYNNFTPDFFRKSEMEKINTVPGYRKKKARRWATLVNKSEEVILEAHKQWSALNPEINMSFDELIEQMSGYTNLGYNKLIDPKYQLPDIANIVEEIVLSKPKRGRKTSIPKLLERLFPDVDPATGDIQGNLFDQ
tara:strand:- start:43 stop:1491 length:1449 start_codon:yes stop_codon:yes gene_type:complete